jgi:rare lipoprotein A
MLARAKRVFPGVVVSVMLAAPALASGGAHDSATNAHTARKVPAVEGPRRAAAHSSRNGGRQVRQVVSASRWRRGMRLTTVSEAALVNDGTLWSEVGREETAGSHGLMQTGLASWYGGTRWQGRMMSSGERFDAKELTAAHATLPLGSLVRVSLLEGGGSVVVKITDRPGTRRRIIDLSEAAARALGILGRGVAMVSLEPL